MTLQEVNSEYRRSAIQSASSVDLMVTLCDMLLEHLRRAAHAMEDVETRADRINQALAVLGVMQGTLKMEDGGEAAQNMDRFYTLLRAGIVTAHAQASVEILERQIALVMPIRAAWAQVRDDAKVPTQQPTPVQVRQDTTQNAVVAEPRHTIQWSA